MTFKKVILVGLTVLLMESIAGYVYLTYRKSEVIPEKLDVINRPNPLPESSPEVKKAVITLTADRPVIKKGSIFRVDVKLNTFTSHVSATDLTLKYDPQLVTPQASESGKFFTASPLFQKTVFNTADNKQGLATMSAVAEAGKFFTGEEVLTSIFFKALKIGPTDITIVFTPGETRDTNVVADTTDILESAENLSLSILP